MAGRLEGKRAIVTGAAQGLGEAIAWRLAREGASVTVADLQVEKAQQVAQAIAAEVGKGRAIAARVDVTNPDDAKAMVDTAVAAYGGLDLIICNAGIVISGDVLEFDAKAWRKVIDINLVGYFVCAQAAARVMIPQKSGVILQTNSKSGKRGSFRNSAYAASKFGGIGLTQSLALELAPYGIRVNSVCPGNLLDSPLWNDTLYAAYARRWNITVEEVRAKYEAQVPMGRGCSYDDVTNVMVFLASEQSSYMTGQAVNVTGGQVMD
jgi:sorbitol-6-phosphate 2-dehydrogenase